MIVFCPWNSSKFSLVKVVFCCIHQKANALFLGSRTYNWNQFDLHIDKQYNKALHHRVPHRVEPDWTINILCS